MKRITQLKDQALEVLDGRFGKAALATLGVFAITFIISFSFSLMGGNNPLDYFDSAMEADFSGMMEALGSNMMTSLFQTLVSIFFTVPLTVGAINTYRVLVESKGSNDEIFSNFFRIGFGKSYLHIVLFSFVIGILQCLLIAPAAIILLLVILLLHNVFAIVIFALAMLVYVIWIALMYSQTSFIIVDNPQMDIIETMRRSRTLMQGKKTKYLLMELSFIGWILLGIFTLCIGYLWLAPYIRTTEAAFYCDIKEAETTEQA